MASSSYTEYIRTRTMKAKSTPFGPPPQHMAQVLDSKSVKYTTQTDTRPAKKRKVSEFSEKDDAGYDDDDELAAAAAQDALAEIISSKPKKAHKKKSELEEKRLKRFRAKPPVSYLERLARAKEQRMFLIERNRTTSEEGTYEEEVFDIAGTTGNM